MNAKILMLLSNAFDPDPRVHQEAVSLAQNGYDVQLLCWDREGKAVPSETVDGMKVERIVVRSTHGRGSGQIPFLLAFWLKAFARARSRSFDIVHCHDFDTLPLGYALSALKRKKLVYDAHESYVDMLENIPAPLKTAILHSENFFLKRTHLLITVGEVLRQSLAERGAPNTCVVGNWKDPARFRFAPELLSREKSRLRIENGNLVVSFIANLGPERQIPQLIDAASKTPGCVLVIGGDGPCGAMAEDAARKHPNIRYLGRVNPSRVPLYTALSDVVFYGFDPGNTNARFSAPNKLFEALASGKAVITGNFGEIGRIVREERCGIVLRDYTVDEIRNALLTLQSGALGESKRRSMEAGAARYSWSKANETLLTQYRNLGDL
jgi:glycosyltransferase involved in cell wall biosynthesis